MRRFACFLILFVGVIIPAFAETLKSLPIPTGPYQVGITKYELTDPFRKEIGFPSGRLIPIQIYFPTQKGAQIRHPKLFAERTSDKWHPLDVEVYSQKADLTSLATDSKHPLILLNHGDTIAMTNYASIAEDLASHGYIVVAIQHQLRTDPEEPNFWKNHSLSRYAKVIDNMLYVFEWLQNNQTKLFNNTLDLKKVGLIGHSMGGSSLLLFANRSSKTFKNKQLETLLPYADGSGVKEAIIVLDPGGFSYPIHHQYPIFFLFSEKREAYQKKSGTYDNMVKIGHKVKYYKGAKHLSFMDHGYIDPPNPTNPDKHYFNGTLEERKAFFDQMRKDIRDFLTQNGI